uniref:Uncharacterized protein n=1 Tax=Chromera velia CCMP2878 TaxID=1169474 RepID=A0A0G4FPT3_9ALVE|eukprot:Cvel_3615.t1-p1 / transcript=Cvel_3615.t1 / gene=Cvel_3615 / organism=Chromera_velia_CCMP2878 / gene_product=hypothetical protein / transcript_product=hypothetical protein / location=Cvel_scaffold148:75330-77623(+) / protein_length=390 / sequence_SO=supercontig / SO=protein_coding / is_pseudo=false
MSLAIDFQVFATADFPEIAQVWRSTEGTSSRGERCWASSGVGSHRGRNTSVLEFEDTSDELPHGSPSGERKKKKKEKEKDSGTKSQSGDQKESSCLSSSSSPASASPAAETDMQTERGTPFAHLEQGRPSPSLSAQRGSRAWDLHLNALRHSSVILWRQNDDGTRTIYDSAGKISYFPDGSLKDRIWKERSASLSSSSGCPRVSSESLQHPNGLRDIHEIEDEEERQPARPSPYEGRRRKDGEKRVKFGKGIEREYDTEQLCMEYMREREISEEEIQTKGRPRSKKERFSTADGAVSSTGVEEKRKADSGEGDGGSCSSSSFLGHQRSTTLDRHGEVGTESVPIVIDDSDDELPTLGGGIHPSSQGSLSGSLREKEQTKRRKLDTEPEAR